MSMYWERSEGDDAVIYGYQDRYTARIVEGRVWRWQVGDDREPARLAGRTTRGMNEAQEMCALAVRLLELSDAGADVEGLPSGEAATWALVDDLHSEGARYKLVTLAAAGASEIADLRDQIGERDGVIAQLRAKMAERERDGALVSKIAHMLREAGVESPDLPADYDVTGLVARLKARATGEVKVGDRVMWCDKTLTGVVVDQWMGEVAGEMQCRVRSDDGREWQATINELEVIK